MGSWIINHFVQTINCWTIVKLSKGQFKKSLDFTLHNIIHNYTIGLWHSPVWPQPTCNRGWNILSSPSSTMVPWAFWCPCSSCLLCHSSSSYPAAFTAFRKNTAYWAHLFLCLFAMLLLCLFCHQALRLALHNAPQVDLPTESEREVTSA